MSSLKRNTLAVVGMGRVGLPLSLVLADNGFKVIGLEKNPSRIKELEKKHLPFKEIGALKLLKNHFNKNFRLGKISDVKKCSAVIICVGTFLDKNLKPDLKEVYKIIDQLTPYLEENVLLILRSTIHPGGTEKIAAHLKKYNFEKLKLVYAPERIAEGFAVQELYKLPQIIGSFDKQSAIRADAIFKSFAPKIVHSDPRSVELAKLVLNTYRYSKFALANELMMIVDHHGRDIHNVLELANYNYLRGGIPSPGLSGGPCLAKDSFFLRHRTPYNTLITGSHEINTGITSYLLRSINKKKKLINKKVAILGLGFKKNIDDDRGSLSLQLIEELRSYKCEIAIHDPYLANTNLNHTLLGADIVIIAVDHARYQKTTPKLIKKMTKKEVIICDIWNMFKTKKIIFEI